MTPLAPAARPVRSLDAESDRKFAEAAERGAEHDRRCLDIIENELPAIRADLRRLFGEEA